MIPESLADEATRQKLAKARKQTRSSFAKKLKLSKERVRHVEKRAELYLSTMRYFAERKGGSVSLFVTFPDQPPVILSGLGVDIGGKRDKKEAVKGAKTKGKTRRAA
jgi:hypothetical protein